MTSFSSAHQGVLDSLLNRLEGVTSRLEGLQVRGIRSKQQQDANTIPFSIPSWPVCRELQPGSLLTTAGHQRPPVQLHQTAVAPQLRRHQLQTTQISLIQQFPLWSRQQDPLVQM